MKKESSIPAVKRFANDSTDIFLIQAEHKEEGWTRAGVKSSYESTHFKKLSIFCLTVVFFLGILHFPIHLSSITGIFAMSISSCVS